jgi:fluoroacetyl-CoA thioesterase
MQPGPPRGAASTLEVTVTPDMTAYALADQAPPVCGTAALVSHVERVCRELLEPHLEPDEQAVGAALELSYRVPVPVGESMRLTATVAVVGPSKLVCEVQVRHAGANVARGSYEQVLLPATDLAADVDARRTARD